MTAKVTISIRYFADTDNNTENRYITSTLATFALVSIILCTCRLSIFAIRAHVQCGFPTKAMISQARLICIRCAGSKPIQCSRSFLAKGGGGGGGGFALLFRLLAFVCLQSINLRTTQLLRQDKCQARTESGTVVTCHISDEIIEVATIAILRGKRLLFYLLIKIRSRLTRL